MRLGEWVQFEAAAWLGASQDEQASTQLKHTAQAVRVDSEKSGDPPPPAGD